MLESGLLLLASGLPKGTTAGGIKAPEVTLRTGYALDAIAKIAEKVPEAIPGAGTVIFN